MKKFKNLVIGGIENKVVNLILITVIVLAVAFQGASFFQNRMLTQVSNETNAKQEETLTTITSDVMGQVVDNSMTRTTQLEALIADEVFHHLAVRVEMLGQYAHTLFENPEGYPRSEYAAPNPDDNGEIVPQLILAEDTDEEAIADKIGLSANMSDMMISFPGMILAIAVAGILGGSLINAMIALTIVTWTKYARLNTPVVYPGRGKRNTYLYGCRGRRFYGRYWNRVRHAGLCEQRACGRRGFRPLSHFDERCYTGIC